MAWSRAVRSPSRAARNNRVSSSTAIDDTGGNPSIPSGDYPRMTCMQIHQAISARLDGEDPGLDDATVYAHLATCAECRAFAHSSETLHRRVRLAPAPTVPDLTPSILTAIGAEEVAAAEPD